MINSVLTGDIVQSTRLSGAELDAALAHIRRVLQEWDTGGGRFTRNRGDGWQAVCPRPYDVLDLALALIANLRVEGLSSRISIGIGAIDDPGTADLSDARGPAFSASGHALDQMQRGQILAISGPPVRGEDKAIVVLLNERISRWSREQAEAVARNLDPNASTDKESARRLGITPQAMSNRLYSAGYPSMYYALTLWRDAKIEQGWADP